MKTFFINLLQKLTVKKSNAIVISSDLPPAFAKDKAVLSAKNVSILTYAIISLLCLCLSIYLTIDTVTIGTVSANSSYQEALAQRASEIYRSFYQKSFDISEENHHVTNRILISLDDLEKEQKLEVLDVSCIDYVVSDENHRNWFSSIFNAEPTAVVNIVGQGVFTIDLEKSEFLIDNDRNHVLMRLPAPVLERIEIEKMEKLSFKNGSIFKNSPIDGSALAIDIQKKAQIKLYDTIANNQDYYQSARTSAELTLTNLVKQLNPQLPDLTVEVEFLN